MGKIITLFAVMFFALVGVSAGAAQLVYVPASDIIYGYQRGCVLLIPYSRADLVKAPFATRP
jgi:hypothetical protein